MPEEAAETKQDLISAAKQLPKTSSFSLRPRNFEEAYRFSNLIAESDLIPKEFRGKPANVLICVQLGMELGVPPMQALQNIAVINGRPTIWGDLVPALLYQSGLCEQFDEEGDATQASCTVKRKGFAPITRTFTMEEARKVSYSEWIDNKKVQMTLADKQTYKSYPKRMLQMRARAYAVRDRFADVLKGMAIREEVEDFVVESVDITPESKPLPLKTPQPLTADDLPKKDKVYGEPKSALRVEKADVQPKGHSGNPNANADDTSPNGQLAAAVDGSGEAGKGAIAPKPNTASANRATDQRQTDPKPSPDTGPSGRRGVAGSQSDQDQAETKPSPEGIAILAIDGYEKESWPDAAVLKPLIKDLDERGKERVCRYYNLRKREILGA